MASSDESVATTDVSLSAQEPVEHILEEEAPATASQDSACGRGKGRKKRAQQTPPKKYKLTAEQEAAVLDFLKERPYLYSKGHHDYKDPARRQRDWAALGESLGVEWKQLEGWYKSMRTLLGRAKKEKSKSGSGADLTPALRNVWEKMSFLTPHLSFLQSQRLGPGKRSAREALDADAELDPDQAGPSCNVPRRAAPSTSGTSDNPARPAVLPDLRAGSSSGSAGAVSGGGCCGQLCTQLEIVAQRLSSPQDLFWTNIQWKVSHLDPNQLMNLQDEVWDVVSRHVRKAGPKPFPRTNTVPAAASSQAGVEGPVPPQDVFSQAHLQPVSGQAVAPEDELEILLRNYSPIPRLSPRKANNPRRIPPQCPRGPRGPLGPRSTITSSTTSTICLQQAGQLDLDFLDDPPDPLS
eukprot:TRINITY_DN22260_c0_g4_i1.p1 TRINITY_DN22260_c0_g4~~TRINITY_DN22260_c0_g4_i1.p1  ORF type:complete len:409 (-),score=81.48 TRINITY_DN22260_c0_g4_i1:194-1420(-)